MTQPNPQQALELQQQGDLAGADNIYKVYCQNHPDDFNTLHQWCILKLRRQQYDHALDLITPLIKQQPDAEQYQLTLAKIQAAMEHHQEAENIYLQLLQKPKPYLPAHIHLGNLYFHLNQIDQALTQYELALSHEPQPELYFNYGLALAKANRLADAIDALKKVLAAKPDHLKSNFQLAEIYRAQEKFTPAISHYLKVISVLPQHIDAHLGLALCYLEKNKTEDALEHLILLGQQSPPVLEAHELLAKIYTEKPDYSLAIKHYLHCISLNKSLIYYYNLAVIYMNLQRHAEAIDYFHETLALEPNHFESLQNLGAIYLKVRKIDQAIAAYERALPLASHPEEIAHILAALTEKQPPDKPPPSFVSHLFDSYAPRYEEHLTEHLKYKVPQAIQTMLSNASLLDQSNLLVTDAGCGTGLCGAWLAPHCQKLIGIDLSAQMLAIAAAHDYYDQLIEADMQLALADISGQDLIVAADVLTYIGELKPLFIQVQASLKQQGHFIFSVESSTDKEPFQLNQTLRYAHHRNYLLAVAKASGFRVEELQNTIIREDHGRPVVGYIVLLQKEKL